MFLWKNIDHYPKIIPVTPSYLEHCCIGTSQCFPVSFTELNKFCDFWARGYKTCFMLNSAEHEILNAHKYNKYQEIQHISGSYKPRMLFFQLINVKLPTMLLAF